MTSHPRNRCCGSILASIGLLTLIGCGEDDGIGKRYPVKGVVTLQGEPVPKGTVNFMPDEAGGRSAAGDLKDDGSYSATTLTPGDGMLPGKYKVSITAIEIDLTKVHGKPGGLYRTDLINKAPRKLLVPKKYESPATSGLTIEVKPESNKYDIALQ
jgi:hypothetical protein